MADKILRPIVDVEIVEQMTENDTVLIEQNGEIKRTKGVIGSGGAKQYIIDLTLPQSDGEVPRAEWRTESIEFETLTNMIKNAEFPDIIISIHMGGVAGAVEKMASCQLDSPEANAIIMLFPNVPMAYLPDGTLAPQSN